MRDIVRPLAVPGVKQRDVPPEPNPLLIEDGEWRLIDEATGKVVAVQTVVEERGVAQVREWLRGYRGWTNSKRDNGMMYGHVTFGYRPRQVTRRRDYCAVAELALQHPEIHRVLEVLAMRYSRLLVEIAPEAAEEQAARVEDIMSDWRLGERSYFTSGIINNFASLAYHYDGNNPPHSWSAMLVLRRWVRGGHLHIPAYNLVASCPDRSVLYFPGCDLMHGVTPFRVRSAERGQAYRYSIVWYAVQNLNKCLACGDELKRARVARTGRERQPTESVN